MSFSWKDKMLVVFDSNICRLCAGVSDTLVPIFNLDNLVKDRVDLKIKKCFPSLIIDEQDSKPKHICIPCMSKLDVCNELFDLCCASESKFNTILNEHCSLQDKETVVETCVIKQTSSCLWPGDDSKTEKTLTVHDGGVIVLSKMDSDILDGRHQTNDNRDFVVMVELKYKEPDSLSSDTTSVITSNETQDDSYTIRDKLHSLVTYTEDDCDGDHSDMQKNKLCETAYVGSEIKDNDIQNGEIMLFEHNNIDSSKEKCLRLISNNCDSVKKGICDKVDEQSKKRIGVKCPANKRVFVCSICSKQFQRRTRLNSHMAIHTEMRPHSCDQCNESFVMRWDLTLHQRIHLRTFECQYCKKIFNVRSKLDRHIRTHTGERPHMCGYCCKSFSDKRNLDNHLRTHTGEKPYVCNVCDRGFRVRTHLTDHQRVHTKETPYRCDTCGKTFRWKANYNMHLKIHVPIK